MELFEDAGFDLPSRREAAAYAAELAEALFDVAHLLFLAPEDGDEDGFIAETKRRLHATARNLCRDLAGAVALLNRPILILTSPPPRDRRCCTWTRPSRQR